MHPVLQTGQILDGKYRIIRELGTGAMGAVYEGEHLRIHRRVAIKVLLPALAENRDTVHRFEREAQAAGRIGSEHIVEVLDLGILYDGGFYMVMEFLEGITLRQKLRSNGRVTPREIVPVVQQLLTGLEMAHEAGIIHRDLKPDNVFLVREHAGQKDFVKVLDFGVSKFNPLHVEEGLSMTRTGAVVGTPFYMSPEQAKGARDIDPRSDLYSVGIILYESVTGQVPFHAGTFNELIFKIVLEAPPPAETFVPDLQSAFSRIIRKAMARDRTERFQNAAEFREALSVWLHTGRDGIDDPHVVPPPVALDFDEDKVTAVGGKTQALDPNDLGTQVMQPGTVLLDPEPPEDQAKTTVRTDPLPPSSRRKPPPSRRRADRIVVSPTDDRAFVAVPPPPPTMPMAAAPMMPIEPGMALTPSNLPRYAPTPIPPPRDDDALVIAGLPRRRNTGAAAIAVGVVIAVGLGGAAGIMLLTPRDQEVAEEPAPTTGETPGAAHAQADEPKKDQTEQPSEPTTEAPPKEVSAASDSKPRPRPPSAPRATPRPSPPPAPTKNAAKNPPKDAAKDTPTPSSSAKSTSRRIKTEL